MKNIFCPLTLLLLHCFVFAQQKLPEFGKIDAADLRMSSCSFDPGADAMKIFDVEEVNFEPSDFQTKMFVQRRVRIKIFNEKGYQYASIRIPYFSKKKFSKFKELRGAVYNLDESGKITVQEIEKNDFFKSKVMENLGMINFTFPNLRPGSVIEFTYTKVEKNILQIDPWVIRDEIPTAYTSRTVITPGFAELKRKVFGGDSIDETFKKSGKGYFEQDTRTYSRENIKAFQPEPYMSSFSDNIPRVFFFIIPKDNFIIEALTSSDAGWRFAGGKLMESEKFGGQIKKNIPGTEAIVDTAKKISSVPQRIDFIYQAVKQRMAKSEQTMYPEDDLSDVWKDKNGNSAEINLILQNLLQKADVKSFPILVSTRDHGKIMTDFPSLSQFNGIDVFAVDSNKYYMLDASLKFQSYQTPPANVLNTVAFLLDNDVDNLQWVKIDDERPLLMQSLQVFLTMSEKGMLEGYGTLSHYDYAKTYQLDSTIKNENENERLVLDKKTPGLRITSFKQENINNDNQPLVERVEFNYEPQNTGQFYFINPLFLFQKKINPFIKETRNTDIDFGCNQQIDLTLQIDLPGDYLVDYLPKNLVVSAPDSSFNFRRVFSSDAVHIYMTQILEIKRSLFDKDEYSGVQEFFNRIYPLMTDEIVLKKKK